VSDRQRTSVADKLFIGWFGPRGLATIVFAVLVLDEKLPGNDTRRMATRPSTQAEHSLRAAG
jgi:NhaP-type Na+/H+ or K+/H+ antiporter